MEGKAISTSRLEGQSTTRPPLFEGTNYTYWKLRMKMWLQANDFSIWEKCESAYVIPEKPETGYTVEQIHHLGLNAKAMNSLYCALSSEEFNRISQCETAHEIWRTLEVTHEGTSKVKSSKINLLSQEFEAFSMKENEKLGDMYTRFTLIVNNLKSLGKTFIKGELQGKLLRSLGPEWEQKVTAIEEANQVEDLDMENLLGNLMAYE